MANIALKALGAFWDRRERKANNATMKTPMAPVNKLRLFFMAPIAILLAISIFLQFLLVFAGSKPGFQEDYSVFTLNVSRIGEGIHQKIDGAIDSFNVDVLHIDLKRSAPVHIAASITAAPTTLITMAPRGVGSVFKSLTGEAGDGVESADSAVHSKASSIKSKASSAANAAESQVNSGLDSAANKLKVKLRELVDESFKDIIAKLDLQGFYSVHVTTTCQGDFVANEKGDGFHKKVNSCSKDSPLNPMQIVAVFYWAGIVSGLVALVFTLMTMWKPADRWINWTFPFLIAALIMTGFASALSHGIATAAEKLVDFIGEGISVDGIAGNMFIRLTWLATIVLFVVLVFMGILKWYLRKHPEKAEKGGMGGMSSSYKPPKASKKAKMSHSVSAGGAGHDYAMDDIRESAGRDVGGSKAPHGSSFGAGDDPRYDSASAGGGYAGPTHQPPPMQMSAPPRTYDSHAPSRLGRESQPTEWI